MSNASRGLERHVDPDNPTGPKLTERPDLSDRSKRLPTHPKERSPTNKKPRSQKTQSKKS